MRFITNDQCEAWLAGCKRQKPDATPGLLRERIVYPSGPHGLFPVAHWTATNLLFGMPALLWISEWGIWGSSENLHLYYRLRQSYADFRLIQEAPGHMFLGHEAADLASFLQLAMLNGWGGYLLTEPDYASAFFSHDGFIDFYSDQQSMIEMIREAIG